MELRKAAQGKGLKLLSEDGIEKALAGITTVEEVARVCEEHMDLKASAAAAVELQPVIGAPGAAAPVMARKPQVKEADISQYSDKIANWLNRK